MLIKLTYYGTNKPTLVNMDKVQNIYQIFDKINRRMTTKVCFDSASYINVEEEPQTIQQLEQESMAGKYQDTDWATTIDERFEDNFQKHERKPRNQFEIYNDNQW